MDLEKLFPGYEFTYVSGRMYPREPIVTLIWVKDLQDKCIERTLFTKRFEDLIEDDHKRAIEGLKSKIRYYEHRRKNTNS